MKRALTTQFRRTETIPAWMPLIGIKPEIVDAHGSLRGFGVAVGAGVGLQRQTKRARKIRVRIAVAWPVRGRRAACSKNDSTEHSRSGAYDDKRFHV
jgi:hypothetical protein